MDLYNVLGIQYLRDGLVSAVNEHVEIEKYRIYHTDCLYLLCCALNNNPGFRYADMIRPVAEEDTRSCDDIVSERLERFGIKVVD